MRECKNCVYAKWQSNSVYCMFFSSMSCPKGKGDVFLGKATKPEPEPEPILVERPNYPDPVEGSKLTPYHYEIYAMRYEEKMKYKDIAAHFNCSYPSITQYMAKCDLADIEKGNTLWRIWQRQVEAEVKAESIKKKPVYKYLPPPPLSDRAKTRYENHPLRKNHDEIFKMLSEGCSKRKIAEKLDLKLQSLYHYIQVCEDNAKY